MAKSRRHLIPYLAVVSAYLKMPDLDDSNILAVKPTIREEHGLFVELNLLIALELHGDGLIAQVAQHGGRSVDLVDLDDHCTARHWHHGQRRGSEPLGRAQKDEL